MSQLKEGAIIREINNFYMSFFGPFLLAIVVAILLEVFVFLPLPLYLAGKITKIDGLKFSYKSCIWMTLVTGIVGGVLGSILQNVLLMMMDKTTMIYVWTPLAILISFLILGFMLRKTYQIGNGKIVATYVLFFVFAVIANIILTILLAMMFSFSLVSIFKNADVEIGDVDQSNQILNVEDSSSVRLAHPDNTVPRNANSVPVVTNPDDYYQLALKTNPNLDDDYVQATVEIGCLVLGSGNIDKAENNKILEKWGIDPDYLVSLGIYFRDNDQVQAAIVDGMKVKGCVSGI